jgi:hypothetical protein
LVGIERETGVSGENRHIPFGARTFALVALLGTAGRAPVDPAVAFVLAAFVATIAIARYLRPPPKAAATPGRRPRSPS